MADTLRVMLEIGTKDKQVAAVAPDWPGLERGAKTEEAAIARLQAYLPRYAPVANLAGMGAEFADVATVDVVERYRGTGSTDFWHLVRVLGDRQTSRVGRSIRTRTDADAGVLGIVRHGPRARVGGDAEGSARGRARSGPHRPAHVG